VQSAAKSGGFVAVVAQRAPDTEQPRLEDLYPVGTLTRIVHLADTGSGCPWSWSAWLASGSVRWSRPRATRRPRRRSCPTCSTARPKPRPPGGRAAPGKELVALRDDIPDEAAQILDRFDDPARLAT